MSANNHDRLVQLKPLTAERARKIAAGLHGVDELLRRMAQGEPINLAEVRERTAQLLHIARLFEAAANQPELPETQETALGKL